ncbi:hypothetical protein PTSG_09441 [Salpingoeca rosetta]|uniref:DUF6787 domain-containing protein n=1 Tax=Salpingoeca rosetta (strain ATCC 50818 / BSB-021) TaxID=946362 RepID=F2UMM5_SALR5|nr:uncharacterized protein PTSG_09441 [Salpingoeca rosetta]EGD78374.1 hypothetical protein PTSG_09441 [Salpingoeca rosetta]|eukprot:XP_004989697.1 hypothetical protein PTSG_09441 [Salpingoeca rosetta]
MLSAVSGLRLLRIGHRVPAVAAAVGGTGARAAFRLTTASLLPTSPTLSTATATSTPRLIVASRLACTARTATAVAATARQRVFALAARNRHTPFSPFLRQLHSTRPHLQQQGTKVGTMLRSWMAEQPEPARFSGKWWFVWMIRFIVFGITGSSSVKFATPLLDTLFGIQGSWTEGPWSFRLASLAFVTPIYTVILLVVGTIFGQHHFFKYMALKMWSRILPGIVKRPAKPSATSTPKNK